MPKIYNYKVYRNSVANGKILNSVALEGVFTTQSLFDFLHAEGMKVPQTIHVFRNGLHQFFDEFSELAEAEDEELTKQFVPRVIENRRDYRSFSVALLNKR